MCSISLVLPGCRYLATKYQDKAGHLLGVGAKERALVDNWLEVGIAHSSPTLSARAANLAVARLPVWDATLQCRLQAAVVSPNNVEASAVLRVIHQGRYTSGSTHLFSLIHAPRRPVLGCVVLQASPISFSLLLLTFPGTSPSAGRGPEFRTLLGRSRGAEGLCTHDGEGCTLQMGAAQALCSRICASRAGFFQCDKLRRCLEHTLGSACR